MAKAIRGRLTYANTIATLALFVALGGGAYAAGSGLISSGGLVQECVKSRGGVPRVVRAHARCGHGTIPLFLATPGATALRGLRGPKGATGPRGHTGKTGATGPQGLVGSTGPAGPQGPGAYAFSLVTGSGPEQTVASKFAGNEMRLVCGVNRCHAQALVTGALSVLGTDTRGPANGAPTSTTLVKSATPAQATLTEIAGTGGEFVSEARATVNVADGSAWSIEVQLANDSSGNVHLIGTATPAGATSEFLL
jgi:hypothetical protein